ncbi:hypothetical protein [Diaphorobacter ruginosibacter]
MSHSSQTIQRRLLQVTAVAWGLLAPAAAIRRSGPVQFTQALGFTISY